MKQSRGIFAGCMLALVPIALFLTPPSMQVVSPVELVTPPAVLPPESVEEVTSLPPPLAPGLEVRGVVDVAESTHPHGVPMYVRVSHYSPSLGGPNCARFVNGVCISKMANGERWQDWMNTAAACPPEWLFGTRIVLDGRTWICKDRGGMVKFKDGIPWIDLLQEVADYPYCAIRMVEVSLPEVQE